MKNPPPKEKVRVDLKMGLIVNLYKSQSEVISIPVANREHETLGGLRLRVKELLGLEMEDGEWRLRRYNKAEDSLHEVYEAELGNCSL